ncbi:MAG: hypothetical protein H7319_04055 [Spirosoma sp.]|nr:hypothetical protein [Spirosoma sp.]
MLPLPDPDGLVLIGYAYYDAPNIQLVEQLISYPGIIFSTQYPQYVFSHRDTEPIRNSPTVTQYEPIFGEPQRFASYYVRVHRDARPLHEYYRLVSEVLLHHWLAGQNVLPASPEQIRETARAIVPYFAGAPANLRDFYIQEGKLFLDWLLKHL